MMNGKMKMKNGKEMQLQEGQMVMMDGKMMEGDKDMKMEGIGSSFSASSDLTTPDVLAASGARHGLRPASVPCSLGLRVSTSQNDILSGVKIQRETSPRRVYASKSNRFSPNMRTGSARPILWHTRL